MKIFAVLTLLVLICGFAFSEPGENYTLPVEEEEEARELQSICPKTLIKDNSKCTDCHTVPDWTLKEASPSSHLSLPYLTYYIDDHTLRYDASNISGALAEEFFDYLKWHPNITHIIIDLHSPGGSLLDAWKIVGMMNEVRAKGVKVTTRCYGFAASAAFIIFVSGDIGSRIATPTAEFMTHELWTLSWLKLDTPSSKEDEAVTMRHLQDTINKWIISRCTGKMTKEELDEAVRYKDYWLNGWEMLEVGLADKLIGG